MRWRGQGAGVEGRRYEDEHISCSGLEFEMEFVLSMVKEELCENLVEVEW